MCAYVCVKLCVLHPCMVQNFLFFEHTSSVNILSKSNSGKLITQEHLAYMNLQTT